MNDRATTSSPLSQRRRLLAALGTDRLIQTLVTLQQEADDGSVTPEARSMFGMIIDDETQQGAVLGALSAESDGWNGPLDGFCWQLDGGTQIEVLRRLAPGVISLMPHSGVPVSVREWPLDSSDKPIVPPEEQIALIVDRLRGIYGHAAALPVAHLVIRIAGTLRLIPEFDLPTLVNSAPLIAAPVRH